MDDETRIVEKDPSEVETPFAWGDSGSDAWKMPTLTAWQRFKEEPPRWLPLLKYSAPAVFMTVVVMTVFGHPQPQAQAGDSPKSTVVQTPTAPPVPNPKQPSPDTYFTQAVSDSDFLLGLRQAGVPITSNEQALKEARFVCQQLKDGRTFRQIAMNTEADHPDWKWGQAGDLIGIATGLCPQYRGAP